MTTITLEELEQELSPEEIEESEQVEPKEIDNKNSPFAHMLANLLEGGGRQARSAGKKGDKP